MAPHTRYSYKLSVNVLDLGVLEELNDQLHAVFSRDDDDFESNVYQSAFVPSDAYERVQGTCAGLGLLVSWRTEDREPDGDIANKRIYVEIYEAK